VRSAIAQAAPFSRLAGAEIPFQAPLIDLTGDTVAAKLLEVLADQFAAVVDMLVIDVNDVEVLTTSHSALFATVGMPEEILQRIRQTLRSPAQ
jgi:hypothetical protein